ncbi:MAG TPA: TolC family protein [Drouetiella sp.]
MKKTSFTVNKSALLLIALAIISLVAQSAEAQNLFQPTQNPAGPTQLPSLSPIQTSPAASPANSPTPAGVGPIVPPFSPVQANPQDLPSISPDQTLAPITIPPSFHLRDLPSEPPAASASAEVLKSSPIKLGALIQVASLPPLSLDGKFNQPITLEEALNYTLQKSLPIRISRESTNYQTTQLAYYMSFFMPSVSVNYALAQSNVNSDTHTNAEIFQTKVSFPLFAGGSYSYSTLAQFYRVLGWREAFQANVNDALLDIFNKYTNLVLNHHLLRIRIKALEVSEAQLKLTTAQYQAGTGTKYAIMQARTQLAVDKQALLSQQVATRQSALLVAYAMDMPLSVNLVPVDLDVCQRRLIAGNTSIEKLLNIAIRQRPELREYEHFRIAAARDVPIGAAPLYPQVSAFVAYSHSNLTFTGNPNDVTGVAVTQISLGGINAGAASNQALGQNASLSPGNNLTAATGANTGAASIVASSGGTPLNNTQSGSLVTSGAVAPSIIAPVSISGTSGSSNINGSSTSSAGSAPGTFNSVQAGINLSWSLPSVGLNSAANVVSLRALSRQALLQANQQVLIVTEQVRAAYLNVLPAINQVEAIGSQLDSSKEALRMAELRQKAGQGTNLEVIRAQSDYVNSLVNEAQSQVALQQAQAQLIHDLGAISVATLTQGYSIPNVPIKR